MNAMTFEQDAIVFTPLDVDLTRSPLRGHIDDETFVLGAFNPGFTRLPNGGLLMMVRVAEALRNPTNETHVHALRWDGSGRYRKDAYDLATVDVTDPRKFRLRGHPSKVMALTSLSWILPVELDPSGKRVVAVHYDKIIEPAATYQEYGVEDARISKVDDLWYMTTCSVSSERHSTTLYTSRDGLNYELQGIIMDHQNKDMLLFEGKVNDKFHALTRPLGELYFAYPPDSEFEAGPCIHLSSSPDALHWKPSDKPLLRPRRGSTSVMKIGGGSAPMLTPRGWLLLYHGVQPGTVVGVYRTFYAYLNATDPSVVVEMDDTTPVLESRPELTEFLKELSYLTGVVFTTGVVEDGDDLIVASGEDDLACRITRIPKARFGL
jgi:predicted GH43/DUF377 family glycosyl hydrolase